MADQDDLDDLVQQAQVSNSNNKPEEENLEHKVEKGFWKTIKKFSLWDWTKIGTVSVAGAIFGGGLLGFGALNVSATIFSYVLSKYLVKRKQGFSKNDLQAEFIVGGAVTPVLYKFFNLLEPFYAVNPLLYAAMGALGMFPFTAIVDSITHLAQKYTLSSFIKGLFKLEPLKDIYQITKNVFTKSIKGAFYASLFISPLVTGVRYFLPQEYLIASLVPIRTAYRTILGLRDEKKDPQTKPKSTPQLPYSPQPAYR